MAQKNMVLPFITQTPTQKQEWPYPAEIACVVCMAESQRKKPGFLRDMSEKTDYIAKAYYPLWITPVGNRSLILDGLAAGAYEFNYEEPAGIDAFIEELKKNSPYPQRLSETLRTQVQNLQTIGSPSKWMFQGLIGDREILTYLLETLKIAESKAQQENALIPTAIDEAIVNQTVRAFMSCQRTLQANQKGLQQALDDLGEELAFHRAAAQTETLRQREKADAEIAITKPSVDKAVKKLTQKHDKATANMQRAFEKQISTLERSREKTLRKLQATEKLRDAAQKRLYATRRRNSSSKSGVFSLQKYERDVEAIKRAVKAVSDQLEKVTRERDSRLGFLNMEFRGAVGREENKIYQIESVYRAQAAAKQSLIAEMTSAATIITANLQSRIDELKRNAVSLGAQVGVDFVVGDPDDIMLVQVPVYVVKYARGREERQSVIFPITITRDTGVMDGLKKMLSLSQEPKLKVLVHPASQNLQDTFGANLLGKMQNDVEFHARLGEVCRGCNLVDQNNFGQVLNQGLDEIERLGWITREEASTICRRATGKQHEL
jgi:hypothetical protein